MISTPITHSKSGFTLIELLISISILGILAGIAAPIMKTFVLKTQYSNFKTTLHQLMNGQETYFLEKGVFYPDTARRGTVRINSGQEIDIPKLGYKFPAGHKHRYDIQCINRIDRRGNKTNYYTITVYADFDYNGNGINDYYIITTYFLNEAPYIRRGVEYYRYFRQVW